MRGGLASNVSAVGPLGDAIDGSVRVAKRSRPGVRKVVIDPAEAWGCPACGQRASDATEHARHMTGEYVALREQVRAVRQLLGDEPTEFEFVHHEAGPWLDSTEAAALLGVGPRRVIGLIQEGSLPHSRRHARSWLVSRTDVEALIARRH